MIQKIPAEHTAGDTCPRVPTLQGMFYPDDASGLRSLIDSFFHATAASVSNPAGILVPHAGYIYSGKTAALSYARVSSAFDKTFVIIGTGHQGYPTSFSDFSWETPLGPVNPDTEFAEALAAYLPKNNAVLRRQENSLEVQMPFIRYRFPQAQVLPILIGDQSEAGAHAVAEAVISAAEDLKKTAGKDFIVVASGDCSHYVPAEKAEKDDLTVLSAVKNLDVRRFYAELSRICPSMCGYGCIAAMAEIGKHFGAKEARTLLYTTSGDVTGDMREVVGYAAMEVV